MTNSINDNLFNAQHGCLKVHRKQPFIDIHCHCLPGVDDGPATMAESIALCRQLVEEGMTTVVATPHQLGRFRNCGNGSRIREDVRILNETLKRNGVELNIVAGSEVHVDERLRQLLEKDKIMTLADRGRYVLLELPRQVSVDITPLLEELACIGVQCIISHVERLAPFVMQSRMLLKWIEHPVHLQITASSLTGDFGPRAQKAAWSFLNSGWAALVATDSHDTGFRRPRMRAAFQSISTRLGGDIANLMCVENPSRVVNGRDMAPVTLSDLQEVER